MRRPSVTLAPSLPSHSSQCQTPIKALSCTTRVLALVTKMWIISNLACPTQLISDPVISYDIVSTILDYPDLVFALKTRIVKAGLPNMSPVGEKPDPGVIMSFSPP